MMLKRPKPLDGTPEQRAEQLRLCLFDLMNELEMTFDEILRRQVKIQKEQEELKKKQEELENKLKEVAEG